MLLLICFFIVLQTYLKIILFKIIYKNKEALQLKPKGLKLASSSNRMIFELFV